MPQGDGTGPRSEGPNSEYGPGNCKPQNQNRGTRGQGGMRGGRGQGRGKGRGNGQGCGQKSGQGRGRQV